MSTADQVILSRSHVPAFLMEAYRYVEAGQRDQALACLTTANLDLIHRMDAAVPEAASCWILLGRTWRCMGRLREAAEAYERAVQVRPEPAVWADLAGIYLDVGHLSEALRCCQEALTHGSEASDLKGLYASCLIQIGRIREGIEVLRELVAAGQASPMQHSQYLWSLMYLPETQPQDLFQGCVHWGRVHAPRPATGWRYANRLDPDRRLRVGYLSADFRRHSVAYTFESLLDARDTGVIEMIGYGSVASPDEVTERLRAKFDRYRDIRDMDDGRVRACVEQDGIDVLVAIGGHTRGHRLGVLASGPAPIQVDHGSVTTVGMDQIRYRLTDEVLDPPASRRYYLEELVYLPGGLVCYRPDDVMPDVGPLPARRNGCVTFGSFAHHLKIHTGVVGLWAAVLRQVQGSRLLIKCPGGHDAQVRAYLDRQFQACGVDAQRVRVLGWIPKPGHWDLYNQVDIALDTYPFNGCLTTLEGLWMGVPTVTLMGETYVSRVGADILGRVGMGACVASTPDQMVAKAVALAGDLDSLARIRAGLRERMKVSPLYDARRFAREMEAAYRRMWQKWCEDQESGVRSQESL
jgi:predicted O-linked N-acetylglucosamine transferase (SPINDLY family)